MTLSTRISVNASPKTLWAIISDIEHATERISGIEKVEVLEKPESGLAGLKWRETRSMFGKQAVETMWITEAEENHYYQTRAENHGMVYISRMFITKENGQTFVGMSFEGKPQTFGARIMGALMMPFFKKATKKALLQDLQDIKKAAEKKEAS